MTYLLDTDTCINVLRQRSGMVQRLSQEAPTDCAVSMITVIVAVSRQFRHFASLLL